MNRSILIICIWIAALPSFAQRASDPRKMIFTADQPVLLDMVADSSLQRFTPLPADTDKADSCLVRYFSTAAVKKDPHAYYRQYVGFITQGKKFVFINASCQLPDYFGTNTFYPKGGGHCYFRVLIDWHTNQVHTLLWNAPK